MTCVFTYRQSDFNVLVRRQDNKKKTYTSDWGIPKYGHFEGPPHGNSRNSETKSLKIDPKVPNRRYRRGLQTGH